MEESREFLGKSLQRRDQRCPIAFMIATYGINVKIGWIMTG